MTKTTLHIIIWCCCIFTYNSTLAQQPAYSYYTLRDGLPSNDIYNCIQDKKGFLWVATENGLSRFDGKNFKNYSVAQGLPDNDILNVQIDSSGRVWVMPFQKTPAYYDVINDRFINSKSNKELEKILFGNLNNSQPLIGSGMGFCNNNGQIFIYKNNKSVSLPLLEKEIKTAIHYKIIEFVPEQYLVVSSDSFRIIKNKKIVAAYHLGKDVTQVCFINQQLYIAESNSIFKISILPNGSPGKQIFVSLPFVVQGLNFTGKQLAISSGNGNIYLADTASLAFSQRGFSFNSLIRNVYEDKAGNTWICTKENGLIRYQQKGILSISEPAFQRNFNTITFFNNYLVAGTNDGQLLVYKGPYQTNIISLLPQKNYSTWIRKMIPANNNLYVAAEGGLFKVDDRMVSSPLLNLKNIANKDFIMIDDTTIVAGNSGIISKFCLNKACKTEELRMRSTALVSVTSNNVMIGSNAGLYEWINFKTIRYVGAQYQVMSNRISSLAYNKSDEVLWVGLATDTLVAMHKNNIVGIIPLGSKLPGNNCRTLYSNKKGIVWVGTNMALGRINYELKNRKITYTITVFTTADGIAGKQINNITERNDTVYVATTAGISIIPSLYKIDVNEIPVYFTGIKINNKDTGLFDKYVLSYLQNNIAVNFAAADLGASEERYYEYNINNAGWISTRTERIELQQLSSGDYTLQVRAINRNGISSKKIAEVSFRIGTVFWRTIWFALLMFFCSLGIVFYFLQIRSKQKREEAIQKLLTEKKLSELELKALKAQINPHFVFNCLNSIKYLNHQKRFEETEHYLDKFSYLLRKTLDFSGLQKITFEEELLYCTNYLELEKLRLGNKLSYEIIVDEQIDITKSLVPPMLLQPYLENAIKHGIRHLPGEKGKIIIEVRLDEEQIIVSIYDNGVGLEKSSIFKSNQPVRHQSYGTTLQQRRADLYNVQVQIVNGKNDIGTVVNLVLKNEIIL